jgi:c-di-GMP-binding flagellar brake protein YcgR
MTAKQANTDDRGQHSLVADESGYETTQSQSFILRVLERLRKNRTFLTLYHKGYQSGSTVLLDHGERLVIDRPHNWPVDLREVRVSFRDEAKLWNHFKVRVLSVDRTAVYTELPTELFQLQRRNDYRIDVPRGSRAIFVCKEQEVQTLAVDNISSGGMLIRMKGPVLFCGDTITDIHITLPVGLDGGPATHAQEELTLMVGKAQVVRTFTDRGTNHIFFGIKFSPTHVEEEELHHYVRQRERELLKKGVSF